MHTPMREDFMQTHAHAIAERALDKLLCFDNSYCFVKGFKQLFGESHTMNPILNDFKL